MENENNMQTNNAPMPVAPIPTNYVATPAEATSEKRYLRSAFPTVLYVVGALTMIAGFVFALYIANQFSIPYRPEDNYRTYSTAFIYFVFIVICSLMVGLTTIAIGKVISLLEDIRSK